MLSPTRVDSEISFQRRIENKEEDSDLRASHEREWDDDADSTADGDQSSEDSEIQTQLASFATVLKGVIIELNKLKQDRQTFSTASRMDTNNNKDASIGASAVESGSATCTRNGVVGPLQVRKFLDGLSDDELKFKIEFNKDPRNIDEAVYYAVNYIQIRKSGRGERRDKHNARRVTPSYSDDRDFRSSRDDGGKVAVAKRHTVTWTPKGSSEGARKQMEAETDETNNNDIKELLSRIEKLERQNGSSRWSGNGRRNVECFRCHKQGHYARECTGTPDGSSENLIVASDHHLNVQGPTLAAKEWSN
ncbi:hypothetical protein DPMN_170149 [Dreissena polymorpha]|uniref:CCHC-type domain-containing protein n=1 Tax=Dreissena polymorpha TaxID=45954 RepID=A0A9D4DWJ5_DREPO|nr:hypothetical protein DPMN_170149 [Dreissena polymorpha]